jgi:tRNA threonylcarbamoyladenosine biosynthesis protein TsaB
VRNVLIIETSTDAASIALVLDGAVVAEKSFISDRRHNALLFQPLAEIFSENGQPTLDGVIVGSGPGSYSGTRVGIAAAQGAALVANCKAIAVPSILATPEAISEKSCLALGDARRGSFWLAHIDNHALLGAPLLTDTRGFHDAIENAHSNNIPTFCLHTISGSEVTTSRPTAHGLWHAWNLSSEITRSYWASQPPQPIYLAPPHITASKKEVFGV